MAEGIPDLRRMLNEAKVQRDPLNGYFPGAVREERLGFFAIPGEDIVFDKVAFNSQTLASGDIYFESPREKWEPGIYTLVIENRDVHVRLPLTLGSTCRSSASGNRQSPPDSLSRTHDAFTGAGITASAPRTLFQIASLSARSGAASSFVKSHAFDCSCIGAPSGFIS